VVGATHVYIISFVLSLSAFAAKMDTSTPGRSRGNNGPVAIGLWSGCVQLFIAIAIERERKERDIGRE
jgi:hypothetical protein